LDALLNIAWIIAKETPQWGVSLLS
jgi:hypothetical protein